MQIIKKLLPILIVCFNFSYALVLDHNKEFYDLLPYSKIYIDYTNELSIKDIQNKQFKNVDKKSIGFGYSPDFTVWVKFTLENRNNKDIERILEYDNALSTNISLYSPSNNYKEQKEGLANISENRKTINPIFTLNLKKNEKSTYYIKVSSVITTLIVKLNLHKENNFYKKELSHQLFLGLFFGAMFILALYNLSIYFFTKDSSYLFYVMYMIGIMIHHLMYVGLTNVYIIPKDMIMNFINYATLIVGFPALALALFTRQFLGTFQYPKINKILNIYLLIFPFTLIVFLITDEFNRYRNIFSVILLIYLVFITFYASIKQNRQAYFVLFGWFIFLTSGMFMYLSSLGVFNIFNYIPYYVEFSLVIEATVFSIALADRIKQLQKDKQEANNKLIIQQKDEKERLKQKVDEKTKDLKVALDEKGVLLKELNHRVKNNMQTIVSLIRLQNDDIKDETLKDVLKTIQNRISAMGHLHELLYLEKSTSSINTQRYFDILVQEVRTSYLNSNININMDIKTNLPTEQAIYCGLILNELITNSFKYAFENNKGSIEISLNEKDGYFILSVCDDGVGFKEDSTDYSLGLTLVETLATEQLSGTFKLDSQDGVKTIIKWRKDV